MEIFFFCSQLLAELNFHSSAEQNSPFKNPRSATAAGDTPPPYINVIYYGNSCNNIIVLNYGQSQINTCMGLVKLPERDDIWRALKLVSHIHSSKNITYNSDQF